MSRWREGGTLGVRGGIGHPCGERFDLRKRERERMEDRPGANNRKGCGKGTKEGRNEQTDGRSSCRRLRHLRQKKKKER